MRPRGSRSPLLAIGAAVFAAVAVVALISLYHRAPAHGPAVSKSGVEIQQSYDKRGNPALTANIRGAVKVSSPPHWSICPGGSMANCHPVQSSGGDSRSSVINPGPTPKSTVFKATVTSVSGHTYVAFTGAWEGTVGVVRWPTVTGTPRVGSVVVPHAGRWKGGWSAMPTPNLNAEATAANSDALSIEACRTLTGRHCVNLTPPGDHAGYSTRPVIVGASFVGRYLFAFDQRLGSPVLTAQPGYPSPAAMPVVKVGDTAAQSAPLMAPVAGAASTTIGGGIPLTMNQVKTLALRAATGAREPRPTSMSYGTGTFAQAAAALNGAGGGSMAAMHVVAVVMHGHFYENEAGVYGSWMYCVFAANGFLAEIAIGNRPPEYPAKLGPLKTIPVQ